MPASLAPPITRIVLVGLMATGKTTVGTALARRLGWPYRDNDDLLVELAGATARELNERVGPDELHRLEADSVLAVLGEEAPDRAVVSAAASTIEADRFRAALGRPGVFVVWLQGDPARLAQRMRSGPHRPALARDLELLLTRQLRARAPLFGSVADLVLDAEASAPDETAAAIATAVGRGRPSGTPGDDGSTGPGPGG